jgi:hypothetical protein
MSSLKAILTAINNFKSISGLKGCVNDTLNLRDVLKTFYRFENGDIHMLADSRALKPAILDRFNNMIQTSVPGDIIIFHLSDHGSQTRDRHGDELKDNLDELFCCYDMDWDNPDSYILDDDFAEICGSIPAGVHVEILLDTCHSGTGTRNLISPFGLSEEHPTLSRYAPPPIDIISRWEGEENSIRKNRMFDFLREQQTCEQRDALPPGEEYNRVIVKMNHVLWAGCKANQTSADAYIKGNYNGAFTYYFCKHIRDANGKITRPELLKRIRSSHKYEGYSQVVQMETNKAHYYQEVFSNATAKEE